jgi:hypothetical protein
LHPRLFAGCKPERLIPEPANSIPIAAPPVQVCIRVFLLDANLNGSHHKNADSILIRSQPRQTGLASLARTRFPARPYHSPAVEHTPTVNPFTTNIAEIRIATVKPLSNLDLHI